jgi:hypothetical protein
VLIGNDAKLMDAAYRVAPCGAASLVQKQMEQLLIPPSTR